jgi:tetratricopeptide (TPR) repeat protein
LKRLLFFALLFPAISFAVDNSIQVLIDTGQYEKAFQALLASPDAANETEETLYLLGITAPSGKESSTYLKEYMQKFPQGAHIEIVRRYLANYYSAQGLDITASRMYPDFSALNSPDGMEIYRIGLSQQKVGEYSKAKELYLKLLDKTDSELFYWARLGIDDCDRLSGKYDIAITGYKALIDDSPDSPAFPFALLGVSEAYRQQGKLDKAESYYKRYRENFPDSPGSLELEAAFSENQSDSSSSSQKIPKIIKAGYFIQVGVFSKKDNAKICLKKFKTLSYQARIEDFLDGGQQFFRVLLGPYNNEVLARKTKDELEKSQGEQFMIFIE